MPFTTVSVCSIPNTVICAFPLFRKGSWWTNISSHRRHLILTAIFHRLYYWCSPATEFLGNHPVESESSDTSHALRYPWPSSQALLCLVPLLNLSLTGIKRRCNINHFPIDKCVMLSHITLSKHTSPYITCNLVINSYMGNQLKCIHSSLHSLADWW